MGERMATFSRVKNIKSYFMRLICNLLGVADLARHRGMTNLSQPQVPV